MDSLALRSANNAVGNDPGAAALELTLTGPTLRALRPCTVALGGAVMPIRCNGRPAKPQEPMELRSGDELEIGRASTGSRAYLAVAGGIEVPLVLGSRSTCTRAGFGGLHGRVLQAGDRLAAGGARAGAPPANVPQVSLPQGEDLTVRVVLGPQDDSFLPETIDEFLLASFKISPDADRMGYRLTGHPVRHSGASEILSDGVVLGSIQVPPHGDPIVMLAD